VRGAQCFVRAVLLLNSLCARAHACRQRDTCCCPALEWILASLQWQAWRLLYAAIRLRSGLRVPAAVIDLLISFLKQPLSKAEDIIASDIDDHIASQSFAISYAETSVLATLMTTQQAKALQSVVQRG